MAGIKISELNSTFDLNDTDVLPLARPGVGNDTTHKIYGSVFGKAADVTALQNDKVTKNNAITGATKTKITYDSKGLVTSGSDLAASDLPLHVIATNTGLGSQHTISGATAGQVLRATGATAAAFQTIQASDLPLHVIATNTGLGSQHTISGATAGQVLRATGATAAAFQTIQASDLPSSIDASKIANGDVSNQEFQYLSSVTSDIQAQINTLKLSISSLGKTWADFKCP